MAVSALAPVLTPHGRLILAPAEDAPALPPDLSRTLQRSFARDSGHGLLHLGADHVGTALPPVFGYWRELATRYVTAVCTAPDVEERRAGVPIPAPPPTELETLAAAAPPMTGAEYLTASVLQALWEELDAAFCTELSES